MTLDTTVLCVVGVIAYAPMWNNKYFVVYGQSSCLATVYKLGIFHMEYTSTYNVLCWEFLLVRRHCYKYATSVSLWFFSLSLSLALFLPVFFMSSLHFKPLLHKFTTNTVKSRPNSIKNAHVTTARLMLSSNGRFHHFSPHLAVFNCFM